MSEGDLIKYTLNFEFRQVHFSSSPRGETKLLWQQNVLVLHFRAICRETNVICAEASLGSCPEDRKIGLMWGCTHKHKHLNCKKPEENWLHLNFKYKKKFHRLDNYSHRLKSGKFSVFSCNIL